MPRSPSCADPQLLQSLVQGVLPVEKVEPLMRHLERCSECVATLHGLKNEDTLNALLRRSAQPAEQGVKPSSQTPVGRSAEVTADTVALDENARRRFEGAWRAGQPQTIEACLPAEDSPHYRGTLEELVHIDLEFQWKRWRDSGDEAGKSVPPTIEAYLARFPHLDRPEIVCRLAEQEYRVRIDHGDHADVAEYQRRFPGVNLVARDPGPDVTSFLAPAQQPGELGRLGSYRVLKVLGMGGMGIVYQAEDPDLQRLVALKVMKPEQARRADARQRFVREARAVAAFNHDHILSIFQVAEDRGVPFIAMPLLAGETLDDRLKRENRLSIAETLRIGAEIADGLDAAHARGIIHRDIKPGNVWLETRGKESGVRSQHSTDKRPADRLAATRTGSRVKIMDFGLARPVEADSKLTQSGMIVGSPAYMAPEQAGAGAVDGRADLFSLGCVLYRLCTGQLPFRGKDAMATLLLVATEQPAAPREVSGEVPAALSEFIMRLLAKSPTDRPGSAGEVAETLRDIEQATSSRVVTPPGSLRPPLARRWRVLAVLGGVAALIVAAVVLFWRTPHGTVRIEINDPAIQVVFDKDGATIKGLAESKDVPVRAGEHFLTITHGKLTFDTKLFQVRKGDTVAIKIEMLDGKVQVTQGDRVLGEGGTASRWALEFDGASSYVELPPFDFDGDRGFTVEGFINPGKATHQTIFAAYGIDWSQYGPGKWAWGTLADLNDPGKKDPAWQASSLDIDIPTETWTHFAIVARGKNARIYVNGREAGRSDTTPVPRPAPHPTFLGSRDGKQRFLKGQILELRLSFVPRYNKDFIPALRLGQDADTFALYHFDEGQGDKLIDSSGNGRHGKIVGAKWTKVDTRELSTQMPGPAGHWALEFDGKSGHVELPAFDFDANKGFTTEGYISLGPTDGFQNIMRSQDKDGGFGWQRFNGFVTATFSPKVDSNKLPPMPGKTADVALFGGAWTHCAFVTRGREMRAFVNGKEVAVRDPSRKKTADSLLPFVPTPGRAPLIIGLGQSRFVGMLRELRLSTAPRYLKDFSPPSRLQADADTYALYHFDEGQGDKLGDSSGNGRHGKNLGAKWVKSK